ncbi:MAG: M15 family metallopeptidase [Spirochaetales bacterium]|nr:M15 family metallopeptidase [Spirochaetales bacterium]
MRKFVYMIILLTAAFTGCRQQTIEVEDAVMEAAQEEEPLLLHPSFNLTEEDLAELCSELPGTVRQNIEARPQYFLQLLLDIYKGEQELVRLVNKEQGLSSSDVPHDLVALDDYRDRLLLSRRGHQMRSVLLPSLMAMTQAARQEGIDLMISSTYRSYDYQEGLYNRYVERDGREAADRYSARPGKSQHQLGTAVDFGSIDESFAATAAGMWLKENAWHYGFSLSYPQGMESYTGYMWESWHYRYIGEDASKLEQEFFEGIQERMLRFINSKGSLLEAALI